MKKPNLIKQQENAETGEKVAKISLQDCLACSGCVTSAETVLIQQHSIDEFLKLFADLETKVFIAVSPQSLASLAFHTGLKTKQEAFTKLKQFFISKLGVENVINLEYFNQLALELSYLEFKERFQNSAKSDPAKLIKIKKSVKWNREIGHLPILTSECPGWVCYAEKTIGADAFPFMSRVKSPQQLCGKILKLQHLINKKETKKIKFVTIMPCYDKKLEAVRPKLNLQLGDEDRESGQYHQIMEVDTVLATHELLELFDKFKVDLADFGQDAQKADCDMDGADAGSGK